MESHEFGGGWTELKLDLLEKYLKAYGIALKNQNFKLIYIDAFAGTGESRTKGENGHDMEGSALRALNSEGFSSFIFIEENKKRFAKLKALCARPEHLEKDIHLFAGDANHILRDFLKTFDSRAWRAVVFLDPYGLSVNWETLEAIAATHAIDVWYLFSISGLARNAANRWVAVDSGKEAAIDRALGTPEWRSAFYSDTGQGNLFDSDPHVIRHADIDDLELYVRARLKVLFPEVLLPVRLPKRGSPLYSLFFAIANKSPAAIGLAKNIAGHIIDHA
ncbi:MAG: hypothetical protein JWM78_955 [Verrucomicrobiaceae bacterium]|nr:hypothetical protein [Verrucomicrobiaceae bacterium]